jgi:linoleate 10R-lipoxygenase
MGVVSAVQDAASNTALLLQWLKHGIDDSIKDIHSVGIENTAEQAPSFLSYITEMELGKGVNDTEMRQERLLSWLFKMAPGSKHQLELEHVIIQNLWDTLPHPSPGWSHTAGPQYHRADGSHNNVDAPHVGQAGQRYIRDVVSRDNDVIKAQQKLHSGKGLPDPEVIFEKLFRRRGPEEGGFKPHPGGISANMFYFATLVTHDLFNTDTNDRFVNKTTSYVDMGWLYGMCPRRPPSSTLGTDVFLGWNQEMQASIRDKSGYKGKLYTDVFADNRLNLQPPGVITIAILFCRNHNWIAEQLLIKSKDDFRFATMPADDDKDGLELLDEHLFQTARNINIGTFATAVLYDYVRMLMGVNRENTVWTLPVTSDLSSPPLLKDIPKATGNQCSIEFNFIYRWHSVLSREDEQWVTEAFKKLGVPWMKKELGDSTPFRVPSGIKKVQQSHEDRAKDHPKERDYFALSGSIKRDPNTLKYPDADLASFLHKATDWNAGAFGGRQVPEAFKDIEIMGIRHGRQLGVCTLNELRRLCKLREYTTFEEMNSDPVICQALKELYGDVANVELYPGLVAEEAKPKQSGSGLCAGRTITYAALSDVAAMLRGDRFLTTELNPYNLTQWGYAEIQPNTDWSFGNILGDKLLNRHLGEELMPRDSIYTQFMFSTPEETKTNLSRFGMEHVYRETRV